MANPQNNSVVFESFGIEIFHSRHEAADIPPDINARATIQQLESDGEESSMVAIAEAIEDINSLVLMTAKSDTDKDVTDLFTASQIQVMQSRVNQYLGKPLDQHLNELGAPPNFPFYVGRLATHFISTDDISLSNLYTFLDQHSDPTPGASGPQERNSRELAVAANNAMLKQFEAFYQADLQVTLGGPTKKVEGSRISWERGIAESQFLILDYVRDQLATSQTTRSRRGTELTMTATDIEQNLLQILGQQAAIVDRAAAINPVLGQQIAQSIEALFDFTREVMHRGRLGTPKYMREPENTRRAISRVESLLVLAASLDATRDDQEEIPILEI